MYLAKPLAFPAVRSFSDLFEVVDEKARPIPCKGMLLTTYCNIDGVGGYRSLRVRPKQAVVDYAAGALTVIENDHLYWKVVVRDGGEALVVLSYNSIIGSRWIAVVDPATLPKGEE